MLAHAGFLSFISQSKEKDLFARLQAELVVRYNVDSKLASEMASDLIEVLSAVDGDIDIFEKYFLQ
ncbi:MAG TPA: hypothetical protein VNJ01_05965 [Bacteriovoracaceae bacterium]|nr:hypothetical protein [Bacteriovoracaceae bacterium]